MFEIKSLHTKLLICLLTYRQSLSNFCERQIMIIITVSSCKKIGHGIQLNADFYLLWREKSDYIFSHQDKTKCIFECCDVGKLCS